MAISSIVSTIGHWIIPPLNKRVGSAIAPFNFVLSSLLIFLSCWIRFRYPSLGIVWRFILFVVISIFVVHNNLSCYVRFPWQSKEGKDDQLGMYTMFDIIAGGGIFGILTIVLDFLFLAREEELNLIGVKEYRKYLTEKYPNKTQEELVQLEKEVTEGGTFERPKYYPGTKIAYIRDLCDATRGLGYEKGLHQKGISQNQGGYFALMEMEKLQSKDPKIAKELKRKVLIKTLKTFGKCILAMELCQFLLTNKHFIKIDSIDQLTTLDQALRQTNLPKPFAKQIITALFGCAIVARLQALSAFVYLIALIQTNPFEIPITIGRWEPLLFFQPHKSISMTDMWGKHWHGLIRRSVTICFMRPSKQLAKHLGIPLSIGRMIGVLLSFAYSGLMHEAIMETMLNHIQHLKRFQQFDEQTLRSMGYGWGASKYASTRFFVNCGLIIILEELWKSILEPKLTLLLFGKQKQLVKGSIRNVIGWIWCMSWMVYFGMELVQVWCKHGMYAASRTSILVYLLN